MKSSPSTVMTGAASANAVPQVCCSNMYICRFSERVYLGVSHHGCDPMSKRLARGSWYPNVHLPLNLPCGKLTKN